jgi:hypothetical protein
LVFSGDWYDPTYNQWEETEFDNVLLDAALQHDDVIIEPVLTPFTWRSRHLPTIPDIQGMNGRQGLPATSVYLM